MATEVQQKPGDTAFKVSDEICRDIQHYSYIGLKPEQIAKHYGVTPNALNEMRKQYPKLEQAIQKGQFDSIVTYARMIVDAANKGDVSAQIYMLDKLTENYKSN